MNRIHVRWVRSWWRHQMETFSALLAICVRNSPVPGEFPAQRPVSRRFDVFFDLPLNKRLRKHSWGWWFETLSGPLWRQSNVSLFAYARHDFEVICDVITQVAQQILTSSSIRKLTKWDTMSMCADRLSHRHLKVHHPGKEIEF